MGYRAKSRCCDSSSPLIPTESTGVKQSDPPRLACPITFPAEAIPGSYDRSRWDIAENLLPVRSGVLLNLRTHHP